MNKFKTVLLVDDDYITNFITKKLLDKLKIAEEIKVVHNGAQGIDCLEDNCFSIKKNPEIIFLDINMPAMDGFEFVRNFNDTKLKGEVIICVLTTSTNMKDIEKMKKLGVKYFLNKPLTKEKLEKLLLQIDKESI